MASALLLSAVLLHAQVLGATVSGRVTDADTGAPLAGAVVELPDLARVAVTDDAGRYELQLVASGPQHLVARTLAYGELTLHALVPGAGTLVIDVALHPAPLALSPIDVRVPLPVRGVERTDSATPGDRVLTIAAIRNHPMLAEPDAFQALVGGEVVVQPESPSGLHLRGGASDHTAYVLDGVPVLSPYHAAGLFSAWNPDALAGVRLTGAASPPPRPIRRRCPGRSRRDARSGQASARGGERRHRPGACHPRWAPRRARTRVPGQRARGLPGRGRAQR